VFVYADPHSEKFLGLLVGMGLLVGIVFPSSG